MRFPPSPTTMIGRTLLCIAAACAATSAAAGKIRGDSLDELQKLAGDSEPAAAPTAADAPEAMNFKEGAEIAKTNAQSEEQAAAKAGPVDWPPKGVGMVSRSQLSST